MLLFHRLQVIALQISRPLQSHVNRSTNVFEKVSVEEQRQGIGGGRVNELGRK